MATRRNRVQVMMDDESYDLLLQKAREAGKTDSTFAYELLRESLGLDNE